MAEMIKEKLSDYTMKMRIYPSKSEAKQIDDAFHALQLAYNMTFHEVFLKNPEITTVGKDGSLWPDFKKMAKATWTNHLKEMNPAISLAPAAAITTNNGLFLHDAKKAWETGMHDLPIEKANRKDFSFYNSKKPRRSFMFQMNPKSLKPSPDNPKVAFISLLRIGKRGKMIKARGFNRKIWFGENGEHTYEEAVAANELPKTLSVRVSKDACNNYYVSITISKGCNAYREVPVRTEAEPIGIDVGIKDIAILSDGTKYENIHFRQNKLKALKAMNRKLSRRWGPANPAFRDYNGNVRSENRKCDLENQLPLATPSSGYLKIQNDKAKLELKIANRRNTYYHQNTAEIVNRASLIAVETLRVKNMKRNHKLAFALDDAAMSSFISKLKYKAAWRGVELVPIGTFEPSSQLCSNCGESNPAVKDLSIRLWTCPKCGAKHDRDINAAKNILRIAQEKGGVDDKVEKSNVESPPRRKKQQIIKRGKDIHIFDDKPNIVIRFSKELTAINDPRYIIVDTETDKILDDAQGFGFRSACNAKNSYKSKMKRNK